MKRPLNPTHAWITLALAGVLLPGCAGPTATMSMTPKEGVIRKVPVKTAPAGLAPLPRAAAKAFVATTAGGTLTGTVKLEKVDEPYFQNSAAPYRVQAAPTNLGNAMITLSTLQEEIYAKDGKVIDGLTGLDSAFTLTGLAPKDKPYVVNAGFVQSHRLSGFAFPDGTGNATATVNEASTMVVEMARWQLPEILASHAAAIATLYTNTTALLGLATPTALTTDGGTIPNVSALKHGAGHEMRNAYVAAFGARVEPMPGDLNAIGNKLSDTWKALLGYRPLALTRAVGNGARGFNQGDGKPAAEIPLGNPTDAVLDHNGNLWVVEQDGARIRFVPKAGHSALLGWGSAMTAGNIYTLIGNTNSPGSVDDYNYDYEPKEAAGIANAKNAPKVTSSTIIYAPRRLVLKPAATSGSHLFYTSKFAHRVYFVPGGNPGGDADPTVAPVADSVTMFGRTFYAGRLYTLAGNSVLGDPATPGGENAVGTDYSLNEPTGLAQDSVGNLYILDSIAGKVRVLRAFGANAGKVITLNLESTPGTAYDMTGAQDLSVVEGAGGKFLYVADTNHHVVVRFALPAALTDLDGAAAPAAVQAQLVMGQTATPGFIKLGPTDVYPDIFDISKPITEDKALLNAPTSLTFDDQGNMIVGAKGRIHLMEAAALPPGGTGNTYVIAGGVDTRNIVGDSRLGFFPDTTSVRYDPITKNTLVVDFSEQVVRRLWTARGAL
ncbi:NHL repeat protein [compost metagenome]